MIKGSMTQNAFSSQPPPKPRAALRTFLLGGLLPVLAFTIVENVYGAAAGVIAGIVFGVGELIYEYSTLRKLSWITIMSNALIVVLGGLSLVENSGAFFKLQPAILFMVFALFVVGSSLVKKPFLVAMARKQRPDLPETALAHMSGLNLRMGICLFGIGLIGVHAAFFWSTAAWATFKAVGAPALMVGYMVLDMLIVRWWRSRGSRGR